MIRFIPVLPDCFYENVRTGRNEKYIFRLNNKAGISTVYLKIQSLYINLI